jgi:putative ABC transport system ATP-binding protein
MSIMKEEINKQQAAVACSAVEKWFGEGETRIQVLRGIDFTVRLGELAMLVGPSGCGKTTLISVIAGLLDTTAGEIELFGTKVASLTPEQRILFRRNNLGFVFQQFNLLPSLTAAENVAVPLFVAGNSWDEGVKRGRDLLDGLGMGDRVDALPRDLSGGQQQRVALARALIHEPRLIVCDEPTSALDAKSGMRVMELLSAFAVRPDRAVIVVTHDSRVFEFADSISHMEDGRIQSVEEGKGRARAIAIRQNSEEASRA